MSTFSFEAAAAWLCPAVAAVLGGTILCQVKSRPGQRGTKVVCLAGLWGGACLLRVSVFWGVLLFSLACLLSYHHLSGQALLPVDQRAVLVTGGDTGLGHALCKYLDELGFTVFAGVLAERGPGAEGLRRTCSSRLCVLQLDVTAPEQIKDAHSKVAAKLQKRGLWAVINNAGIMGFPADAELIPMAEYRRCMAVNFFGAVEVTKAFLPLLRKSKGRLVNISSMAGGVPMERLSAYGSSKAALTMFSAVMRQELSMWGVKVSIVQPGGFKTNITGTSDTWDRLEKTLLEQAPPAVREAYGQEYILKLRDYLHEFHRRSSPDMSPLLLDVQHAVLARRPLAFYTPGRGSFLFLCLASMGPTGLLDYCLRSLMSGKTVPRGLRTPSRESPEASPGEGTRS
ncbi:17-beta-hydroxysteroid dehydrogenase type 2 [Sorex araneus]|uniref:17-beta-hydroxysteroid dehydrogenase type 2 n=1 Tax=Sorex araneus TaxID=42254 RepID=UPI002433E33E|nr:17-beta-hydroxysteroid dehydrogenase type 2 [Sorex araneus]